MAKAGGRKVGSKNNDADIIQRHAKKYAKKAIAQLAALMDTAPEKAVRVSAANAILDRAYGKPTQQVNNKVDANISVILKGTDTEL